MLAAGGGAEELGFERGGWAQTAGDAGEDQRDIAGAEDAGDEGEEGESLRVVDVLTEGFGKIAAVAMSMRTRPRTRPMRAGMGRSAGSGWGRLVGAVRAWDIRGIRAHNRNNVKLILMGPQKDGRP